MRDVVVRLLALAVAVAMVVGALALRDRRGSGGDLVAPDDASETRGPTPDGDLLVVCSDVVAFACEALETTGVAGRVSVGRGVDGAEAALQDGAVLVTVSPVSAMLDDRARRAGDEPRLVEVGEPGWSSPVVAAIWEDRAAVLDSHCGGTLGWPCLGDAAGGAWTTIGGDERWGAVAPAHADPARSTVGLLALAQGIAAVTGDTGFTLRDLQTDDTRAWLTRLERAIPAGQDRADQLERMLTQGRSAMDVGLTLEAEAASLLPRAGSRADGLELRWLEPWLEARVVVAGADRSAVDTVMAALATAGDRAVAAGWRLDGAPPAVLDGAPQAPTTAGTPSPGALEALLQLQAEVVP